MMLTVSVTVSHLCQNLEIVKGVRSLKWASEGVNYHEQRRGSLSAFSHMDTSDLHPQTRREGGVYRVTWRVCRNN